MAEQFKNTKDEVKSAKDVMQETAKSYTSGYEPVAEQVLSRRPLPANSKFSFCPYCVKRARARGDDYTAVCKPLWLVTYRRLFRTGRNEKGQLTGRVYIEKEYHCPVCKEANNKPKVITAEDFESVYTMPSPQYDAKQDIPLTEKDIRAAGFEYYGR